MKKRLFVIDGHALCYRAYYAFIKNPLVNSSGQNTSAIYGFARMLLRLIQDEKPEYLTVAFDPPKKTFRFDIFPEYKANREKMPDDLGPQIDEIKRMLSVLEIAVIEDPDHEADDVLGSIAAKYASKDLEVVLVTGDKDAYQLVKENVIIYANKKGISEHEVYDREGVVSKLGITPEQVTDYMALTGDSSDNVPGVRGVGEKTAQKLIAEYGNLEAIYENLESIRGKLKEQLSAGRESAYLSRDLVTIRTGLNLDMDLQSAHTPALSTDPARRYFVNMEMPSIVKDFLGAMEGPGESVAASKKDYRIIRTADELDAALIEIRKAGIVSVDTETTAIDPVEADIIGISFSIREGAGWYLPLAGESLFGGEAIDAASSLLKVKPLLEDPSVHKVGQNIKYDLIVLKNAGVELQGIIFDTMIASYLLNPAERNHNMDDMAERLLQYKTITYKELVGKGKDSVPITDVPLERLAEYAVEDADITLRLYRLLGPKLREDGLEELFTKVEMPLLEVLAVMEWHGVKIDPAHFKKLGEENLALLKEAEKKIYKAAGSQFNINSTRELAEVLFTRLKLKPIKKTKTGFSTDISVLEELRGRHEIVDHLIDYRSLIKLKTTYIDALPKLVSQWTGRIHTSYNQTIVATGRLSSSSPNLQNIPVRDEMGRRIREGFVPEKGALLMSADYSQIELRLAAHLSGDKNMIRAFKEGTDIHSLTASSVFGVGLEEVTPDMRRQAKIINFSTIYGVSPFGLSRQADISIQDAAGFIKKYFETYPGFEIYVKETIEYARKHGQVKTLLGRRRPLPEITSDAKFRREGAERVAINTPIQGTSADMIKIAMIDIHKELDTSGMKTKMIMQVHDELVFEVPEAEKEAAEALVRRGMEGALKLDVPIVVDIGWGKNWAEAH